MPDYQGAVTNALNAGALGYGIARDASNNATPNNTGSFNFGSGFQPGYFNQPTNGFMPAPTTAGMPTATMNAGMSPYNQMTSNVANVIT